MLSDEALRVIFIITGAEFTANGVMLLGMVMYIFRMRAQYERKDIARESETRALKTMFQMLTSVLVANHNMTPSDAADMAANAANPVYQALLEHFNKDELELLASRIGLNIDDVRDGPLPNLALRLKSLADRTGKSNALIAAMQLARPDLLKELRQGAA